MPDEMSPKEAIEKLLGSMPQLQASDLHLKVGHAPYYRIQGALRAAKSPPIPSSAYIEAMLDDLIPEKRRSEFEEIGSLDFAATGATSDRYRINMFRAMGKTNVSIRRVQGQPPTFEELNLPPIYRKVLSKAIEGLVLVSGVTGSGKSSTLAAMLDCINELRSMHIVTIEDPIEFVFHPKKSIISQREIGIDVPDYSIALRDVVRQDPNCILIGELRDKKTMLAAIQAAETGHLVLGALHVADVQQTFSRILEFFPSTEHAFIRSSMAASLCAIMCQRLLPGIEEGTLHPATEILINNSIVREKIMHEKDEELPGVISRGGDVGMQSFTQSLCKLIAAEKVHYDKAMEFAPNREALSSAVKGITSR